MTLREWVQAALAHEGVNADPDYLLELGSVYLNSRRVLADEVLTHVTSQWFGHGATGTLPLHKTPVLRVHSDPKRYTVPVTPSVLAETDDFLAIDKPHGLPSHPTLDNFHENALQLCRRSFGQTIYPTQRLDVGTRGVLCFAKNKESQTAFMNALSARKIEKFYSVFTEGPLPTGQLLHVMTKRLKPPHEFAPLSSQGAEPTQKLCELIVLESAPVTTTGEPGASSTAPTAPPSRFASTIKLITGRTHQIRGQLAALGAPVVGDRLYGWEPNLDLRDSKPCCDRTDVGNEANPNLESFALICTQMRFLDCDFRLTSSIKELFENFS